MLQLRREWKLWRFSATLAIAGGSNSVFALQARVKSNQDFSPGSASADPVAAEVLVPIHGNILHSTDFARRNAAGDGPPSSELVLALTGAHEPQVLGVLIKTTSR